MTRAGARPRTSRPDRSDRSDRSEPSDRWADAAARRIGALRLDRGVVFAEQLVRIVNDRDALQDEATARRIAAAAIATMRRPLTGEERELARQWEDIESRARTLLTKLKPPSAAVERFAPERIEAQRHALERLLGEAEYAEAYFRSWRPTPKFDPNLAPEDMRSALELRVKPADGQNQPSLRDQFIWMAHRAVDRDPRQIPKGERIAFVAGIARALGISSSKADAIKRDLSRIRSSDLRVRIEREVLERHADGRPLRGDLLDDLDHMYRAFHEFRAQVTLVGRDAQS